MAVQFWREIFRTWAYDFAWNPMIFPEARLLCIVADGGGSDNELDEPNECVGVGYRLFAANVVEEARFGNQCVLVTSAGTEGLRELLSRGEILVLGKNVAVIL